MLEVVGVEGSLNSHNPFNEMVPQCPLSLESLCAGIPSAGVPAPPQLQLTKLQLVGFRNLTGLDACLAHQPLKELQLSSVFFPASAAQSMRPASATLRTMRIGLNLTYPSFSAADFPRLQFLELESFDLRWVHGLRGQGCCPRCNRLAMSVSGFPCVRVMDVYDVCVWGGRWPSAQFIALLEGLTPLQPVFQGVKRVCIKAANAIGDVAWVVASLFLNASVKIPEIY